MGMHWLRRGERDLFRLLFVLHGHQEISPGPEEGNLEKEILKIEPSMLPSFSYFEAVAISLNQAGHLQNSAYSTEASKA
jgi:hypothetical protein